MLPIFLFVFFFFFRNFTIQPKNSRLRNFSWYPIYIIVRGGALPRIRLPASSRCRAALHRSVVRLSGRLSEGRSPDLLLRNRGAISLQCCRYTNRDPLEIDRTANVVSRISSICRLEINENRKWLSLNEKRWIKRRRTEQKEVKYSHRWWIPCGEQSVCRFSECRVVLTSW